MNALRRNIDGVNNTVSGMNALTYNIDGSNNSAFGQGTLYNNIGGQRNTANGGSSLYNNTSGNYNTASGFQALYTNATGSYNTAIGNGADVSVDGLTNSTAIGNGAIVSTSNTIQLGDTAVTDVITSGAITGASFKTPLGSASEFLKADGSVDSTTYLTTANAGADFVDLTTDQTIAGIKNFNDKIRVQGVEIGQTNYPNQNTVLGYQSLVNIVSGDNNTAMGFVSMNALTSGKYNTGMGSYALNANSVGDENTAVGQQSLQNTTSSGNTGIGSYSLTTNISGYNNTAIGYASDVVSGALTNATAIGAGAIVSADNTIQLGNLSVSDVKTSGRITAGTITYPNNSGTANQVLTTDGSGVASWSTAVPSVTEADDEIIAVDPGQTSFVLSQTPAATSKVKMYINGIRISKAAYSISVISLVPTLTYDPNYNGFYAISVGDRVQFEYSTSDTPLTLN